MTTLSTRTVIAIVIGNALEWYDFTIYSLMTVFIATLFFPNVDHNISLLAATATLGAAFCMRPLGGIFFGVLADRKGRKIAMTLVMALMTIGMMLIITTRTYAEVGIVAPCIVVCARLLQGFSAGGEFGPSSALLIELAPPNKRGLYGSWQMFGQTFAILLGGLVGVVLTHSLNIQQLLSWGWRIPFIIGLLIAPVGIYIRYYLKEIDIDSHISQENFTQLLIKSKLDILLGCGLIVGGTASNYIILSYLPTYVTRYLHLPLSFAFMTLALATIIMLILIPLFGSLSDRIGRKPILVWSLGIYLLTIYPFFWWLVHEPSLLKLMVVESLFCILLSAYYGVFTTLISELFSREIRATGLSISNNLTVMIFGGFGQFIVTWLMIVTGSSLALTYYLLPTVAITFITALLLPVKSRIIHDEFRMARAPDCF